jgi:hypothetical protein
MGRSTAGESERATQFGRIAVDLLTGASCHIGSSLHLTNRDPRDNDGWWGCATAYCDKTRNQHHHHDNSPAGHDHHHDNAAARHDYHHHDNSGAGHDHHHDNAAAVHDATRAADDGHHNPYRTVTAARDEPRYRACFVT